MDIDWDRGSTISATDKTGCPQNERHGSMRLASFGIGTRLNGKKVLSICEAFAKEHGHCRVLRST